MSTLWWGPLVAAVLHILEEFVYPGGFAQWDRLYRPQIAGSITSRLRPDHDRESTHDPDRG